MDRSSNLPSAAAAPATTAEGRNVQSPPDRQAASALQPQQQPQLPVQQEPQQQQQQQQQLQPQQLQEQQLHPPHGSTEASPLFEAQGAHLGPAQVQRQPHYLPSYGVGAVGAERRQSLERGNVGGFAAFHQPTGIGGQPEWTMNPRQLQPPAQMPQQQPPPSLGTQASTSSGAVYEWSVPGSEPPYVIRQQTTYYERPPSLWEVSYGSTAADQQRARPVYGAQAGRQPPAAYTAVAPEGHLGVWPTYPGQHGRYAFGQPPPQTEWGLPQQYIPAGPTQWPAPPPYHGRQLYHVPVPQQAEPTMPTSSASPQRYVEEDVESLMRISEMIPIPAAIDDPPPARRMRTSTGLPGPAPAPARAASTLSGVPLGTSGVICEAVSGPRATQTRIAIRGAPSSDVEHRSAAGVSGAAVGAVGQDPGAVGQTLPTPSTWEATQPYGGTFGPSTSYTVRAPQVPGEESYNMIDHLATVDHWHRFQEASTSQHTKPMRRASRTKGSGLASLVQPRAFWIEKGIKLKKKVFRNGIFSTKVFIGGLPHDVTPKSLEAVFRPLGGVRFHKQMYRGHAYIIFQNSQAVSDFLNQCALVEATGEYSYEVAGRQVQVIPWALEESEYGRFKPGVDPAHANRTVFIGALHGETTAEHLAKILGEQFGPVQHVRIDTDKQKYPSGSARVQFATLEGFMKAVRTHYLSIHTSHYSKVIQLEPFVEDDRTCSLCQRASAGVLCRSVDCLNYFCFDCFPRHHAALGSPPDHMPLTRGRRE